MKNRTMKADYHVHTEFSDDSEYQMEQVVRDSIAMRLDEICFTDHVDYGVKNDWDDGEKIRYRKEYRVNRKICRYSMLIIHCIIRLTRR